MMKGAILVPLYPSLLEHQIQYILDDSEAKVVIVENQQQLKKVDAIREKLTTVEHFFVLDSENETLAALWQTFESLAKDGENFLKNNPSFIPDSINNIQSKDIATIIYTSGTTGEPKGVVLCHKNFLTNRNYYRKEILYTYHYLDLHNIL